MEVGRSDRPPCAGSISGSVAWPRPPADSRKHLRAGIVERGSGDQSSEERVERFVEWRPRMLLSLGYCTDGSGKAEPRCLTALARDQDSRELRTLAAVQAAELVPKSFRQRLPPRAADLVGDKRPEAAERAHEQSRAGSSSGFVFHRASNAAASTARTSIFCMPGGARMGGPAESDAAAHRCPDVLGSAQYLVVESISIRLLCLPIISR